MDLEIRVWVRAIQHGPLRVGVKAVVLLRFHMRLRIGGSKVLLTCLKMLNLARRLRGQSAFCTGGDASGV